VNIKEYISGGAVESYVLGLMSAQERFEFDEFCKIYPELVAARETFELSIEKQAMENAVSPPAGLKEKIAADIFKAEKSAPVVKMETAKAKKINWASVAAAASIVLLAGSLWWNMNLKNENESLRTEVKESEQQIAKMIAEANTIQKEGMTVVGLGGTANAPKSYATVYWDTTSHDVYLLVNNLPKPASDEQYQLWAILKETNGIKPIDLGFIELSQKPLQVYRMTNAQAANAFAITLEKKDGNPAPNLEKIYVMSKL
jgi:anti-sigma-K factor RskA